MHDSDGFDISAFDGHPAFRLRRGFRTKRFPTRIPESRPRNPNVWPLPAVDGIRPHLAEDVDGAVRIRYPLAARIPTLVPVFAVSDGLVKYAGPCDGTNTLVLDHGDEHRTFYAGIDHLFVTPSVRRRGDEAVSAGDVLGYSAKAAVSFAGLYISVARRTGRWLYEPIDTCDALEDWLVLPWTDERVTPPAATQTIAA